MSAFLAILPKPASKSSPERGGGSRRLTEGLIDAGESYDGWRADSGPSVASRHLPVPGRI
jgi:hypothetical protein